MRTAFDAAASRILGVRGMDEDELHRLGFE